MEPQKSDMQPQIDINDQKKTVTSAENQGLTKDTGLQQLALVFFLFQRL